MKMKTGEKWLSLMKSRQSRRTSVMKRREAQLLAEGHKEDSLNIANASRAGWDTRFDTIGGFLIISF
jgi:hypothetical protein